ncbi:MAG: hypothetical protein Q7K33_00960 [Candidatus Berkelbacteria bacterium]|nr:hypothetical protein [Candidatus Berkelbacteria bacterium]
MDQTLTESLEKIVSYEPKKLKREYGDFQFTDVGSQIESLIHFASVVKESPDIFGKIPDSHKADFANQISQLAGLVEEINNFDPQTVQDPLAVRNQLADRLRNAYSGLFDYTRLYDFESLKNAVSLSTLTNLTDEARKTVKESREKNKQLEKILASAKSTTTVGAVDSYSGVFKKQSKINMWMAIVGGIVLLAVVVVLIILTLKVSSDVSDAVKGAQSSQQIVALIVVKLFYLAISIFAVQLLSRFTFANVHLMTINDHKENSLHIFALLLTSYKGTQIEGVLLESMVRSLTELHETGFIPGKDLSKDSPDILNIVKDFGKPH